MAHVSGGVGPTYVILVPMPRPKLTLVKKPCDKAWCPQFGELHLRCRAHRRDRTPCTQYPITNMLVCRTHGGMAKSAKAAARARGAYREAISMVSRIVSYDDTDLTSPEEILLAQLRWSHQASLALSRVCEA
jgi:hypothetical protein